VKKQLRLARTPAEVEVEAAAAAAAAAATATELAKRTADAAFQRSGLAPAAGGARGRGGRRGGGRGGGRRCAA
jgi:hypothetical protein